MLKICRVCGKEKNIDLFAKGKKNKDGYRNECKECSAAYYRDYYKKYPDRYKEKSKNQKHHKRHGLSDDQYDFLINLHGGMCHLCLTKEASRIDHDHSCCNKNRSCGKCVRGVLCNSCNTAIGLLKEDAQTINRIEEYISRRIGEQASRHSSKVQ